MSEYYVIMRENNNNYPLLAWEEKSVNSGIFYKHKPVELKNSLHMKLGWPIPETPQMVDYHSNPRPVISDKIKDVLEPLEIMGIQLFPVTIDDSPATDKKYWFLHIYHAIEAMDKNLSEFTIDEDDGDIDDITKIVLDKMVLSDIPLEERLIFQLKEGASMFLVHESIKDKIMVVNPIGIRFIDVVKWTDGSAFE